MTRRRIAVLLSVLASFSVGACGGLGTGSTSTDTHGARVEHFELRSRAVRRTLRETVVTPEGSSGRGRGLLVFLHGRGGDEDAELDEPMFAALRRLGARAPVIVFPNGGEGSYWHDRRTGQWGRYVLGEVIPEALRRSHADARRVAVGGISMGSFGAYDLARLDRSASARLVGTPRRCGLTAERARRAHSTMRRTSRATT